MKKKLLSLSAVLLLFVTLAFTASAATIKEFKTNSTFVPVTYSSHKSTSSVTLYGNADYLCMKAYSETNKNEYFYVDIYSDSKRTKKILEYGNTFKKGTIYEDIFFDLTSLKSKNYYATSYVMKESTRYPDRLKVDPSTVKNFKIVVKRDGTSIKNMKCFMYGYENTYYGPAIYWYSVPGATKYYVYKYVDKQYKKIATVKANGEDFSYYIDKSLKDKNSSAYYKVKAVNGTGSTALSLNNVKVITLKTPKVTAEQTKSREIKVTWTKVKDSCQYTVYMKIGNGEWEKRHTTNKRTYIETNNLKNGETYYFAVVASYSGAVSGVDPTGASVMFYENPEFKTIKEVDNTIVLSWEKINGVDGYNVYKKSTEETEWTKIANVKTTEYTDKAVERNKLYTYYVKSVANGKESPMYNYMTSHAMFDVPVINDIERTDEGYAKISWDKIDGVSYKVYRKSENSRWNLIEVLDNNEYIDKDNLVNGEKYYYTVCLYKYHDGFSCEGKYDPDGKVFYYYVPVTSLSLYGVYHGIGLKWNAVKNVERYTIYRKAENGVYTLLGSTTENFYEDTTAEAETAYMYKVGYICNGTENSLSFAEIPAKLSSEYVSISQETIDVSSKWTCSVVPLGFNPETVYCVYVKTAEGWSKLSAKKNSDGKLEFNKDKTTGINEYAITSVSTDGVVMGLPENGFILEYIVPTTVDLKTDHQNYSVDISWKAIEGAEKYNIYNYDKLVATVEGDCTTYKHSKLKPSKYYEYTVGTVKGDLELRSEYAYTYLLNKPVVKVKLNSDSVYVTWKSDESRHFVYRRAEGETKWTVLTKDAGSAYIDRTVKDGKTYYYTVACNGSHSVGGRDEIGKKITFLKPTKITDVTYYSKSLQITWAKSEQADCYQIYRKVSGGSWKLVKTTKDGKTVKYKDTNVKAGTKYTYSVKVVKDGTQSVAAKKTLTFLAPPSNLTAKKADSGIKLSFGKSTGATYYYVYRKGSDGKWSNIAKIKSSTTSYTDTTAKRGVKYSYYVKAYNGGMYSYKSSTVSCKR